MVAERGLEVWKPLAMVIKYWESLCKSKRPKNTSYETLVKHYKDPLVSAKLEFFAFAASFFQPYIVVFLTNSPMIPFIFSELEKTFSQLIRLVFRKGVTDQASTISKKIKSGLQIKKNYLEDCLVDVGSAIRYLLQQAKVSAEKKRSFKGDCNKMIIDILVKLQENTPLRYNIQNYSALVPSNMVHKGENCIIKFRELADKLYYLNKITA